MPKRRSRRRPTVTLPAVLPFTAALTALPGLPANPFAAPAFALAELSLASWETVMWRSWAMLQGTCTPAEFSRMAAEKTAAAWGTGLALMAAGPAATVEDALAPWRRRAAANARRLRRKAGR